MFSVFRGAVLFGQPLVKLDCYIDSVPEGARPLTDTLNFNPVATSIIAGGASGAHSQSETHGSALTILIAEDQSAFATHIESLLHQRMTVPLKFLNAGTGADAVESSLALIPDLVIMDIALPVFNGLMAARKIWSQRPEIKILFWAQAYREIYARDLLSIAPDQSIYGFVLKTSADEDLIYAVSSMLLHNNPYLDPALRTAVRDNQKSGSLSDVEMETLRELALGLTDKAMAVRNGLSVRGIQNRINSLYRKLLLRDCAIFQKPRAAELVNLRARLVFEAVRRGLITPQEMCDLDQACLDWIGKTLNT